MEEEKAKLFKMIRIAIIVFLVMMCVSMIFVMINWLNVSKDINNDISNQKSKNTNISQRLTGSNLVSTTTANDEITFSETTTTTEAITEEVTTAEVTTAEVTTSKASEVTPTQKAALEAAKSKLKLIPMSYKNIIDELTGEFSVSDAVYAADNCGADWNEQALLVAKTQLVYRPTRDWLIGYLDVKGFTSEEITYALNALGY